MSGVSVYLQGPRGVHAGSGIATDAQGRFSFRVFDGVTYSVRANYNMAGEPLRQFRASEAVRISGPPAPVLLVMR